MIATQYEPVRVCAPVTGAEPALLNGEVKRFLTMLARTFEGGRQELLDEREARRRAFAHGALPAFPAETAHIRGGEWKVAAPRADLLDRRVELVGPATRRAIDAALHSGANVYVADLADSTSPTWRNIMASQVDLRDAIHGLRDREEPAPAILFRPRGWHLDEKHFLVDGRPIPAALFDCGLYLFHNTAELVASGTAPYFCLPGVESYREARLWNDLLLTAEELLRVSRGTLRAAVPIETVPAAFEMDEILWELREHSAGLVCAPWEYASSIAAGFPHRPELVVPDRTGLTMERYFLNAYANLMVRTCHRRRTHAIGRTTRSVTEPGDVRRDQLREVWAGHDGTRVAHPDLVAPAKDVFDTYMPFANQIERKPEVEIAAADLLAVPGAEISQETLCRTVQTGLEYLGVWLAGTGTIFVDGAVENATTAELCCSQVRQWIRLEAVTVRTVRELIQRHANASAASLFEDATLGANFHGPVLARAAELLE
jgi:malate synthase